MIGQISIKTRVGWISVYENKGKIFQIKFGDGIVGKKLSAGNIIIIDYLSSVGTPANNSIIFGSFTPTVMDDTQLYNCGANQLLGAGFQCFIANVTMETE